MTDDFKDLLADDPGWGVTAARFNLRIARMAAERIPENPEREQRDEWYLYYGAFLTFLWAALQALKEYDGVRDAALGAIQGKYFKDHIRDSVEFEMIRDARHAVGHAKPGGAYHSQWPADVVARHGLEAVFDDFPPPWPDGPYVGQPFWDVVNALWRKVSGWIDAVDAEDARAKAKSEEA